MTKTNNIPVYAGVVVVLALLVAAVAHNIATQIEARGTDTDTEHYEDIGYRARARCEAICHGHQDGGDPLILDRIEVTGEQVTCVCWVASRPF